MGASLVAVTVTVKGLLSAPPSSVVPATLPFTTPLQSAGKVKVGTPATLAPLQLQSPATSSSCSHPSPITASSGTPLRVTVTPVTCSEPSASVAVTPSCAASDTTIGSSVSASTRSVALTLISPSTLMVMLPLLFALPSLVVATTV